MNILLTACSIVALIGCFLSFTRAQRVCDEASMWARTSQHHADELRKALDRLTVAEREVEALRRELRKLAGKFYATVAELEEPEPQPMAALNPVCENWAMAQQEGPLSPAALCECNYCQARRQERIARRASLRSGVKS